MTPVVADPFVPQSYRVARAFREDPETVTLELVRPDGNTSSFRPGQFNMLYAFGVGEVAISMSGDPADRSRIVHTIRAAGATSTRLAALGTGEVVGVRGPFGSTWPLTQSEGKDVVIVAGGLGLAPLRSVIYFMLSNREKFGRGTVLVGMRNPSNILYRRELEQWRGRLDITLEVTVDHADATWHGNVGVVPALVSRAVFDPQRTVAMVCGPEIMMRFTINALQSAGVPPDKIYLSMERNMKCAIGLCGHCQFGPSFICKDGPVLRYDQLATFFSVREI